MPRLLRAPDELPDQLPRIRPELEDLAETFQRDEEALGVLVTSMRTSRGEAGVVASWILKRWLEDGVSVGGPIRAEALDGPPPDGRPMALLHWLQMLPRLALAPSEWCSLRSRFEHGATHASKFVRAWAFHGLVQVCHADAGAARELMPLIEGALDSEPASVRARIRNAMKGR